MDIVVVGRHIEVKERFRKHVLDKLAKVPQLAPRIQRLDVVVSHEGKGRQSAVCERIEITAVGKGPVVRAEAAAEDAYVALDKAYNKLLERLRRAHDRKVMGRRRHAPDVLAQTVLAMAQDNASTEVDSEPDRHDDDGPDSPVEIREKVHRAVPMTLDQALYEMELVGHDFFLFMDSDSGCPSVVYRRRGWSYGVLRLEPEDATAEPAAPAREPAYSGSPTG
ncbi:MAG TPA: ribosome-associated translation inhibitor RaiA [Actinomycetales bacterium]|nr:ribosome-associated translation inhibitor RaiA [Actinomycetales bacterium]